MPYIICDEERKAFLNLSNDEERDAFIENFWLRRNPSPDSPENEFREEHYRRIAYANEHYAAGKPGWKTDRGRIYITFGPPDSIDSHPSGGSYERPMKKAAATPAPTRLRYGTTVTSKASAKTSISSLSIPACAAITTSRWTPREKDALKYVPGARRTNYEEQNGKDKSERFQGAEDPQGKGPMGAIGSGQGI